MLRAAHLLLLLAATAHAAGPLPTTSAACLDEGAGLPTARLGADGKLGGLPKGHVGPMELAAPPELRFDKVALAVRRLQELGGRLSVVTSGPGGKRLVVPVSLESDLACSPLPASGECRKADDRRQVLSAAFGVVGPKGPPQKQPPPLLIRVTVSGQRVRVQAGDGARPAPRPLAELDGALRQLIEARSAAVTIYVNATGETTWQALTTALAVSHCRLQAAEEQGFDAVLLGS